MVIWGACQQITVQYATAIHVFPGSKPQFHVFEAKQVYWCKSIHRLKATSWCSLHHSEELLVCSLDMASQHIEDELKKMDKRLPIACQSLRKKLPIIRGGRHCKPPSRNALLAYTLKYLRTLKMKTSEASENPLRIQQIPYSSSNHPTTLGRSFTSSIKSYDSLSSESGSEYPFVHSHLEQVSFNFH